MATWLADPSVKKLFTLGAVTFNIMDLITTLALFSLGGLGGHETSLVGLFLLRNLGLIGFVGGKLLVITVVIIAVYYASTRWNKWGVFTAHLMGACCTFMISSILNLSQFIALVVYFRNLL